MMRMVRDGEVILGEFRERYPYLPEAIARDMVRFVFHETLVAKLRWDLSETITKEFNKLKKRKGRR